MNSRLENLPQFYQDSLLKIFNNDVSAAEKAITCSNGSGFEELSFCQLLEAGREFDAVARLLVYLDFGHTDPYFHVDLIRRFLILQDSNKCRQEITKARTLKIGQCSVLLPDKVDQGKIPVQKGFIISTKFVEPPTRERNIFLVDSNCRIVWQIPELRDPDHPDRRAPYSYMEMKNGELRVVSFLRLECVIDPDTGQFKSIKRMIDDRNRGPEILK